MARILIAASPEPRIILERILAGHQFTSAGTPAQATKCLRDQAFDLIICTVLFDTSRMRDFLRLVKDEKRWEQIPFVCAQVRPNALTLAMATEAVALASQQLGAVAYLDIQNYRGNAEVEFRHALEAFIK